MKIESALRRINLLILMLVMGLPWAAPPAMAQEQSCYRLVKAETRADLPKEEDLLWFQKYTDIQRLADGSILAISRSARYVYSWQVWPGETRAHYEYKWDGQIQNAPDFTWIAPPQNWCTGQSAELGGSVIGNKQARLWYKTFPVDAVKAVGQPAGMDPLQGIVISEGDRAAGSISAQVTAQNWEDGWTLEVWMGPGSGDTMGIFYYYELVAPGQEPPAGGTGADGTGSGGTDTGSGQNSRCGLGQYWDVVDTDGTWFGVWTRRGDSNVFDGRWTQSGYQDVVATLTIQLDGNQVTVERQDIGDANNFGVTGCSYTGTLAADGVSVSGSATCATRSGRRTPPVRWSATINCEPSSGSASTSGSEGPAAPGSPWDTPAGQNCFEQWIREAMSRLNAYDGDDEFNGRKPWRINRYGVLEGNPQTGPTSVAAPDNFAEYNYNRYWWMWDQYPAESISDWRLPEWRAAQVPPLRAYVRNCVGKAGGTGGEVSPGSTGTSSVPGGGVAPPPFGSPEPASVSRMTIQAGQRQVVEGQLVNVPVWLIKGADVANINFTIGYNAGVAAPEGDLIKGNLLANALFSSNSGESGLIRAGFAQTSGINGTGTVAYMPFRAVGKPGDRTVLDVGVSTINNPGGTVLAIDRIDGQILIVGPDGVVPGDCDGDGSLTELDALCALQMSVQLIPERLTLDLDTDSQVTSRDSVIILQRAIGK
ncbi:MAG: hypothetical protein ACE5LU_24010 [Anaerolineae bacterium]